MVRLTPELIAQAVQYTNPVGDREIDLRGYKVPVIENLGATLDQFDLIDLSENEIRKIDGFPLLKRLKIIFLNNNRVVRIGENLQESLPNLERLILTGNQIQELGDLDPLTSIKTLRHLCLLHCPVASRPHYRSYVIYKLPQLTVLDFQKIKKKEREQASSLFKSLKGKAPLSQKKAAPKSFIPGGDLPAAAAGPPTIRRTGGPTPEEIRAIKEAIAKARSLEEVERLNQMLRTGHIPGNQKDLFKKNTSNGNAEAMDDE